MRTSLSRTKKSRTQKIRTPQSSTDISRHAAFDQVDRLAWLLDNSIRIPILNYRIGLDPLLGLIPGLGDVAGMVLSSFIVVQAIRLGTPRATLVRMVLNIVTEAVVGLIPMLGDLFDATFKANARNARLLQGAIEQQQTGRTTGNVAGKGAIALILATLIGLIVLVGAVGIGLLWAVISLFRQTMISDSAEVYLHLLSLTYFHHPVQTAIVNLTAVYFG